MTAADTPGSRRAGSPTASASDALGIEETGTFSWFVFGLMASVTFVGILSELVPSGILPQMSEGLGVSEGEVGFLVGVYALASAVAAIPLVSATLQVNRKKLLLMLLAGFAASNVLIAATSSYGLIIACRIVGGVCAGVMWPMIAAHYGAYTYITLIVELIDFAGGVGVALLIFGAGSFLSVVVSAKYIDAHLRWLIVLSLLVGAAAMALFLVFRGTVVVSHLAYFLWGLSFGPLVTMYQTAVSKQVEEAKDVATSVQSSVFNLSIMITTGVGGLILAGTSERAGVRAIVYVSMFCFIVAAVIASMSKRTLRSN